MSEGECRNYCNSQLQSAKTPRTLKLELGKVAQDEADTSILHFGDLP